MIIYDAHVKGGNQKLIIGGVSDPQNFSQAFSGEGVAGGFAGPFPKYSINRENIFKTGAGTYIGSKFVINVTGTAIIKPTQTGQDITEIGQRQNRIQGETIIGLHFLRSVFPSQNAGSLRIEPYGGLPQHIVFHDAKLISVSLPEQNDQSAGVQTREFNFVFEAYDDQSVVGDQVGSLERAKTKYLLSAADESWELTENLDIHFYKDRLPMNDPYKTYTLTHTVSATGQKKYKPEPNVGELEQDGEAFRQAVQWVKDRLIDDPTVPVEEDMMGDTEFFLSQFLPMEMNKPRGGGELGFKFSPESGAPVPYTGYNHVRSVQHDFGEGSYSVTDTWLLSQDNSSATYSVEANCVLDETAPVDTVSLTATFSGLDKQYSKVNAISQKHKNAVEAMEIFEGQAFGFAEEMYKKSQGSGKLESRPISRSVSHVKALGQVTLNITYDTREQKIKGSSRENVTVSYSNQGGLVDVIAVIPVIGRLQGPVIQDMETTEIARVTINADITMEKNFGKPDGTILTKPYRKGHCRSFNENWNPTTRNYSLSETWEFTPEPEV